MSSPIQKRTLQIDEEGYWLSQGKRWSDLDMGQDLFDRLHINKRGQLISGDDVDIIEVEAFDSPLVARGVSRTDHQLILHFPYERSEALTLETLRVDDWDRFHATSHKGLPIVFSRAAQIQFFDSLDEFDDDSVVFMGHRYPVRYWMQKTENVEKSQYWSERYNQANTGWDLGKASPILTEILPQLKIPRQRIAVLGCGSGHDAAHFAQSGHIVTGFDFSEEALLKSQKNYGSIASLKFVRADALNIPVQYRGQFDIVFEHTCYCAIPPQSRNSLVQSWNQLLTERGHLLGIFFVHPKFHGPPWGGSEWEIRERLKKTFDFRYWTRWQTSVPDRHGLELAVWAQKKV